MGKTKTVVISGASDDDKADKGSSDKKKRKKDKGKEKTKAPGLAGGERVVAVEAGPIIKDEEPKKEKKEKKKKREPKERGKKYKKANKKVDKTKLYPLKKAIKLVKDTSYSKFDGSIELHLVVKNEKLIRRVELPHSNGKKKKVEVADEDTIKKLKKGKIDFDILLATKDMMPKLVPFAKDLGPKGLMPNPKNGTLIKDKKEAEKFKGNAIQLKTERKNPVVHTVIGKVGQKQKELLENAKAIIKAIGKRQIVKAHLAPTMGPSVKLEL